MGYKEIEHFYIKSIRSIVYLSGKDDCFRIEIGWDECIRIDTKGRREKQIYVKYEGGGLLVGKTQREWDKYRYYLLLPQYCQSPNPNPV